MSSDGHETAYRLNRRQLLQWAIAASLPWGTLSCSRGTADTLQVGGLPVTCNLTLPVACVAKAVSSRGEAPGVRRFEYGYSKYNGWPEIKESLMAGRIQAAYMLAPLVMDLTDKKSRSRSSPSVIGLALSSWCAPTPRIGTSGNSPEGESPFPADSPSTFCF